MISSRLMSHFLHRDSLLRIFMGLMGFGILILLDSLATIWLASLIGAYVAVAVVGVMTWVSLALIFTSMARHIKLARSLAARAGFPKIEFMHLSSLVISAVLIISPGLLTDILAWILYIPPIRIAIGSLVYRRFRPEFEELNQHLSTEEP